MELRVVGPLEVVVEAPVVELRGQQQPELLAIPAVHANAVVCANRLIDELWAESVLASADSALPDALNLEGPARRGPFVRRYRGEAT